MGINVKTSKKTLKFPLKFIFLYSFIIIVLILLFRKFAIPADEAKLLNLVANDPTNHEKALRLADYYYLMENYQRAIRYYKQGFALWGEENVDCEYIKKMTRALITENQTDSLIYVEMGMEKNCDKNYFLYLYDEGLKVAIGKIENQLSLFDKNSTIAQKHGEILQIYLKKGIVLKLYHELDRSDFYINRTELDQNVKKILLSYGADKPTHRFELAKIAHQAELFEIAEELFDSSEKKLTGRDRGIALYHLGFLSYRKRNYSRALSFYLESRKLLNTVMVNYWLSKTYWELGRRGDASDAINRALRMDPKFTDAIRFKEKISKGD